MNDFYSKLVLKTLKPIDNPDDLILSLDSIEFHIPEILRLDFSRTSVYIHKDDNGICEFEVYGTDFDYDTFKADYEKLGLKEEDFNESYFDLILSENFRVTEVNVSCRDRKHDGKHIPLEIEKIQLFFENEIGETVVDLTSKVTAGCIEMISYSDNPDLNRLAGIICFAEEYSGFCKSFANAFINSVATDTEELERKGRQALASIRDGSIDDFLISACGWSLESLMKQAYILPDSDLEFHKEIISATFVSVWDDNIRKETPCKINTITREIFDIEYGIDKEVEDVCELCAEYVSIDEIDFPAVPRGAYEKGQRLSFWYGETE